MLRGLSVAAVLTAVCAVPVDLSAAGAGQGAAEGVVSAERALVDRYCATCHNDRLRTGGFSFDAIDLDDVAAHPEAFEKVVRKLRAGAMPPRPRPRPD